MYIASSSRFTYRIWVIQHPLTLTWGMYSYIENFYNLYDETGNTHETKSLVGALVKEGY